MNKHSILFLLTIGCDSSKEDTGETWIWNSPALTSLSGDCPSISGDGPQQFISSGVQREVQFVIPENPQAGLRPVFFFHGLMPENMSPTNDVILGLDLQSIADSENMIFILPTSGIWDLMGQRFYLWNIEQGTETEDLILFDDLRSCVGQHFNVDSTTDLNLDGLSTVGFSGGALFNTIVLSQRSEYIASAVSLSGGANLTIPTFENMFSVYSPASNPLPVLLVSGGDNDVWPNSSFPVVDFQTSSEGFITILRDNDHTAYHCTHSYGHTITARALSQGLDWLSGHEIAENGLSTVQFPNLPESWSDWCE